MSGNQEQRHIYYDRDLGIEAYQLSGIVQKFPNHFHEYYVIGFIEGGKRHLWCKGQEYDLNAGDLILFNPRDNHYCAPIGRELLDYRAVNIHTDVMLGIAREITGKDYIPHFTQNVVYQSEIALSVAEVYEAMLLDMSKLKKEESLFCLIDQILQEYAAPFEMVGDDGPGEKTKMLCSYMEQHLAENIALDDLASMIGAGKSYLLRSFTKEVGVSPYRYLQTIRIERAKKLLEQGIGPIDVAGMTGFSDQSHFTNYFKEFIGLTPKQYQRIFSDTLPAGEIIIENEVN